VRHLSKDPLSPLRPGQPGCDFKPLAEPADGEAVVSKHGASAFAGTGLETLLRDRDIGTLVIAGFATPISVGATARWARDLGFEPFVIRDATAAFESQDPDGKPITADILHTAELSALQREFAILLTTDQLLERL